MNQKLILMSYSKNDQSAKMELRTLRYRRDKLEDEISQLNVQKASLRLRLKERGLERLDIIRDPEMKRLDKDIQNITSLLREIVQDIEEYVGQGL